jgi:hypothetical protein
MGPIAACILTFNQTIMIDEGDISLWKSHIPTKCFHGGQASLFLQHVHQDRPET